MPATIHEVGPEVEKPRFEHRSARVDGDAEVSDLWGSRYRSVALGGRWCRP